MTDRPDPPAGAVFVAGGRWYWVDRRLPPLAAVRLTLAGVLEESEVFGSVQVVADAPGGGRVARLACYGSQLSAWAVIDVNPAAGVSDVMKAVAAQVDRFADVSACGRDWRLCDATRDAKDDATPATGDATAGGAEAAAAQQPPPKPTCRRDLATGEVVASAATRVPLDRDEYATAAYHIVDSPRLHAAYFKQPTGQARREFVAAVAAEQRHQQWLARWKASGQLLDLTAARQGGESATREPPTRGRGSRPVHGPDDETRWVQIDPQLTAALAYQHLLMDLCGEGPFKTITVTQGPLTAPQSGRTTAYVDTEGDAHVEVTLADDLDRDELPQILRHELGHVSDLVAAGDDWQNVVARDRDLAENVASAFERSIGFELFASAGHALAAARRARGQPEER